MAHGEVVRSGYNAKLMMHSAEPIRQSAASAETLPLPLPLTLALALALALALV